MFHLPTSYLQECDEANEVLAGPFGMLMLALLLYILSSIMEICIFPTIIRCIGSWQVWAVTYRLPLLNSRLYHQYHLNWTYIDTCFCLGSNFLHANLDGSFKFVISPVRMQVLHKEKYGIIALSSRVTSINWFKHSFYIVWLPSVRNCWIPVFCMLWNR